MFTSWRIQRPVGQGGFHTAGIRLGNITLRYAYDAGSSTNMQQDLDREIEGYARQPEILSGGSARSEGLDILFLSHFDNDHLNGITKLFGELSLNAGAGIAAVILPYLTAETRLVFLLKEVIEGTGASDDLQAFSQDPARWLREAGARRVIFVHPTLGEGPPPVFEIAPLGPDTAPEAHHELDGILGKLKHLNPEDKTARVDQNADDESGHVYDAIPITFPVSGSAVFNWCLDIYVPAKANAFADLVKGFENSGLVVDEAELRDLLKRPKDLIDWIHQNRAAIKKVYQQKIAADHNASSLCLYAGPLQDQHHSSSFQHFLSMAGSYRLFGNGPNEVAWMCTGDANLSTRTAADEFLRHYDFGLSNLRIIMLPHHGSWRSISDYALGETLKRANPEFYACHGTTNQYGHPHRAVRLSLGRRGRHLHSVSENVADLAWDIVTLTP